LEQQLWVDPCNESRSLGLLSAWSLADKETSPFHWTCNVGLQSQGLVRCREKDKMGFGYFYSGLSSDFEALLAVAALDVGDLKGIELYYNAEITPWFHLTTDLQVIEPAHRAQDTALALGVRAKIDL
jgi:porin